MGLSRKRKTPASETNEVMELPSLNLNGDKMDMSRVKQCLSLLQKLMDHQYGWVFNHPVDPIKLGIPDYFSIIKNPMDLGTIKKNLLKRKYTCTVQFAEDVRLTFSNAMLYNPPTNEVHEVAKQLSHVFEARWRLLEDKWAKDTSSWGCVEDKFRREDLNHRAGLAEPAPAKKKVNFIIKCAVNAKPAEPSKIDKTFVQGSAQALCRDGVEKPQSVIRIEKRSDNGRLIVKLGSSNRPLDANNGKCNSKDAISHHSTFSKKEGNIAHQKQCGSPRPLSDKKSLSDGARGTDQHQLLPSSAAVLEKDVDEFPLEEPLSPSRALRAAMLKSRFADTILKAQGRVLLDQGKKVDPIKLQLEREKLERKQQEERVKLEAKVRAAQAAARMKAEADRKLKREKDREAARLALQQVKKTVDLDNSELLKELESLNCSWTWHRRNSVNMACGIEAVLNPLEKLGLFIKYDDDDMDDEDLKMPARADVEEGEIC
ncbi:hypothetical protein LUZ63_000784 [Rhynchospora breviuscula]|uniref:Bromo domain-containing protein n=1 Tax=Rhynchospora breviuscula TaxID=2022672 RepID=A0A9Q0CVP4_9POAL|nr:hypothetical protein LUZ63_000784 [Rhynchospora breviuscula]